MAWALTAVPMATYKDIQNPKRDHSKKLPRNRYSWIADQQDAHKNQFANEPEGLRQFRDHRWKALGKENPDLL